MGLYKKKDKKVNFTNKQTFNFRNKSAKNA